MREYNVFLQPERSLVHENLHIFVTSFSSRYSLMLKKEQAFSVMEKLTWPPFPSPSLFKCKTCHKLLLSLLCQTWLKLSKCYKNYQWTNQTDIHTYRRNWAQETRLLSCKQIQLICQKEEWHELRNSSFLFWSGEQPKLNALFTPTTTMGREFCVGGHI